MYSNLGLRNQKGQALLIIVLVMVIALTVGLSLAARTIINLRNTSEQAGSQKALSAAEAGIEQAIKQNAAPDTPIHNYFSGGSGVTSQYTATVSQSGGGSGSFLLNGKTDVQKNDAIYVWVRPFAENFSTPWNGTRLTIYWGAIKGSCSDAGSYSVAAIEVAVIYGSKNNPKLSRYAFDPCSRQNNFASASTLVNTILNKQLNYQANITGLSNVLLVRINPIYADTLIGISGDQPLAPQGKTIISTGTADQSSRKVTVFEGYPEVPAEFFPYILFQP